MPPQEELLAAEALQALGNPTKLQGIVPEPGSEAYASRPSRSPSQSSMSTYSFSSVEPLPSAPPGPAAASTRPPRRSMFGNMILTATSMLLPRETQHRLRTFVRMLRLANESLSRKVVDLKEAMDQESQGVEPQLSASALRQDMIATIKKSTTLIATVAGNSLPQSARFAVRKMVLSLPSQWRAANWQAQQQAESSPDSVSPTESAAQSAVLSLASETLHLIRDVIAVVDETLDRAESWCGSLGRRPSTESTPDMDSLALHSVGSSDSLSSQGLPRTPDVTASASATPVTAAATPVPVPGPSTPAPQAPLTETPLGASPELSSAAMPSPVGDLIRSN